VAGDVFNLPADVAELLGAAVVFGAGLAVGSFRERVIIPPVGRAEGVRVGGVVERGEGVTVQFGKLKGAGSSTVDARHGRDGWGHRVKLLGV
jgi:hypothetical protein